MRFRDAGVASCLPAGVNAGSREKEKQKKYLLQRQYDASIIASGEWYPAILLTG